MSATQTPENGIPENPPTVTKDWSPGVGETTSQEWAGRLAEIEAKYAALKTAAENGEQSIAQLTFTNQTGRARVVARFVRSGGDVIEGNPSEVTVIEELYAIDVIKDIALAPLFNTHVDNWLSDFYGTAPDPEYFVTNDQIAWVRYCVENRWSEAEISANSGSKPGWDEWTLGMKELRNHLLSGQESYFETGFVLRRSKYSARTAEVKASFVNLNRVVTAPSFSSGMNHLIDALPDGEWLYKPPQAESLGRGRWRITQEWHWADKWSIVYGGSFHL